MSEDSVQLLKTQKGTVKIHRNGFAYVKNRQCGTKIYWKCELHKNKSYQCHSNLITNVFTDVQSLTVLSHSGQHNHEGNPFRSDIANNLHDLKAKTCAAPTAKTCQIIQNHIASTSADIAIKLPSKDALRQVVTRQKKKILNTPKEPTCFDFEINKEALKTNEGDDFVIKDKIFGSTKRVILFSTKSMMVLLGQALFWIMDGTFKVVPGIFHQLYTIHGPVLNCDITFPLLYVLFTHQDKTSYDMLFELIMEFCSENNILVNPKYVILDFEKAAIISLRQYFECVNAKGCFFHLRQIIYRKLQKEGLTKKYNTDQYFNTEIKCLVALYYINPANTHIMYFDDLVHTLSDDARQIAEWFGINYVNGKNNQPPMYSPNFWSQCYNPNIPRTQNRAEAFHHHINEICAKRHVGFYRLVKELIKETNVNKIEIDKIRNGDPLQKKRKSKNEQKLAKIDKILENITQYTHVELLKSIAANL